MTINESADDYEQFHYSLVTIHGTLRVSMDQIIEVDENKRQINKLSLILLMRCFLVGTKSPRIRRSKFYWLCRSL